MTTGPGDFPIRRATAADAAAIAALHAGRITEGFLPTLGPAFLTRLYRRVVASPDAFAHVACRADGTVVGFCATALDVGALYKRFVVRDGVVAGIVAAPRIVRSLRRVIETLRYPSHSGDLPPGEVLAVAVSADAAGAGLGRRLVLATQHEVRARAVTAVKVVAGSHNTAALALYRSCDFQDAEEIEVHEGVRSTVLVWTASAVDRAAGPDADATSEAEA